MVGGLVALFSCFPIVHVVLGILLIVAPEKMASSGEPPPAFVGWLFAIMGATFIIVGWSLAACIIAAGRSLAKRRRYLFCLVMAGIECLFMPFGTVLGVFTIIVLMRESVQQTFSANKGL